MSFFIAEVSSNHSKNLGRCLEFVDIATEIGCDAVKFQLFKIDQLFAPEVLHSSKKHRDRKEWELPIAFLPDIAERCKKNNIKFACTPFYLDAVEELNPFVDFFKISSYELLWKDLLVLVAKTKKPVVVSTGMSEMNEILEAVETLKTFNCTPTLLHCTSSYPTPHNEANLAAIKTIRDKTGCNVGWSDHTVNIGVVSRAIHKWDAKCIEFHLDIDGFGEEYDSGHCWLPEQIEPLITNVRQSLEADGVGEKKPVPSEKNDRLWRADPSDGLRPMLDERKQF